MKKSKFQFSNPSLDKLEYTKNKNFDRNQFKEITIESKTEIKRTKDTTIKSSLVILDVKVGAQDSTSPFFANIIMSSEFHWENSLKEEEVQNLLKCNAPALLFSYVRPHISNLTNSSNYPPFNLPFMDFSVNNEVTNKIELQKDSSSEPKT